MERGLGGWRPRRFAYFATFAIATLLWLPAIHYLLDTPIGLFDRSPNLADNVANWTRFISHLRFLFVSTDPEDYKWFWRFRPFFDVWHGLIWHHFGESFLHYANRLLFAFGTLAFLIAAFRRVCKTTPCAETPYQVLPLAVLAYVWLFFPNGAFALVETVELYTVFFLSVFNYAAALMLTRPAGKGYGHALLAFGFMGLLLSKEPNVALAPWLLVCYLAIAKASGRLFCGMMVGAILGMASLIVLERILLFVEANTVRGGEYFIPTEPILTRCFDNAPTIIEGVTQYHTNPAMTPAICLMLGCLVFFARRNFDRKELAFIVLLIGEFASLFLVLSISHGTERRYWSVLIPLLASLLAFAAKHLLDVAKWSRELTQSAAIGLTAFIGLFVLSNYSNFLFQFISQHSERNLEQSIIDQAVLLVDDSEYVSVVVTHDGLHYRGADLIHFAARRYGSDRIHETPPNDPCAPYYIIDMGGDGPPHDVEPRVTSYAYFTGRTDYRILDYAATLSGVLQGRTPYASIPQTTIAPLGHNKYGIYAVAPKCSGDLVLPEKEAAEKSP